MEVRSEHSFSIGMQKSQMATKPSISGMNLTMTRDGTAVYKPIATTTATTPIPTISNVAAPPFHGGSAAVSIGSDGSSAIPNVALHGLNVASGELMKKKRGRPRKYAPDGSIALASVSLASPTPPGIGGFSPLSMGHANSDLSIPNDPIKKARGRPKGSQNKKHLLAFGSAGTGFTPHVITVKAGEDVFSKIMSFSHHGPRAICILSANGAISNVTLRQAASSSGTLTYEGRFEILSLSGSFPLLESGGRRVQNAGLSISLADPDGGVFGGGVAGLLTAASPVQVIVASFIVNRKKERKNIKRLLESTSLMEELARVDGILGGGGCGGGGGGVMTGRGRSPPSRGTLSESSGGPPSPLNQGTGTYNNSNQQSLSSFLWK